MKIRVATASLTLLLGGCALPVPLQVASWAIEGISFIATKKSLTDHGVSAIAQKDCALWRGVTDGEICRDDGVAVASLASETVLADAEPSASSDAAAFVPDGTATQPTQSRNPIEPAAVETVALDESVERQSPPTIASGTDGLAPAGAERPVREPNGHAASGFFYVIGSFANQQNAAAVVAQYRSLQTAVMPVRVDGRLFYRVAVGPFSKEAIAEQRTHLVNVGIEQAWLLRPAEGWSVADRQPVLSKGKPTRGG